MIRARKSFSSSGQSGNAMIYVLIIVALFAALAMTLARRSGTGETAELSTQNVEIYATQIMESAASVKQSLDQMIFSGAVINFGSSNSLDFTLPSDPGFATNPHAYQVFHPLGGGLVMPKFSDDVYNEVGNDPPSGVYLGRFSNVEWTASTAQDVIYTVYQIRKEICEEINERITGNTAIPALTGNMDDYLVDDAYHTGVNADLSSATCPACDDASQLCVSNALANAFSYFAVLEQE